MIFCYEAKYVRDLQLYPTFSLIQNSNEWSREMHADFRISSSAFWTGNGWTFVVYRAFKSGGRIKISRGERGNFNCQLRLVRVSRSDLAIRTRDGSVLDGRRRKNSWRERERERERGDSETRLRSLVYSRDPLYEDGPFARDKAPVKKKSRVSPTIVICRRYIKRHYQYLEGGAAVAALAAYRDRRAWNVPDHGHAAINED